jgi:uncharacterized membrane protein (DUF2068 family)
MSRQSCSAGLRTVALFEGAKGILVLVVGLGLLSLTHHDIQRLAEDFVRHFHLNPARHYPRIFIHAAANVTDRKLWLLATTAALYASLRLVEAYGLWRARKWAEWFAILSGGIYIPLEIYHLFYRVTWAKLVLLTVNVVVVGYLSCALAKKSQKTFSSEAL